VKNKKYHTAGIFSKFYRKIVEKGIMIDTHNTEIHKGSLSLHGTDTSINIGWVKIVL